MKTGWVRAVALVCVSALAFCLFSCRPARRDPFAFRKQPFEAVISGEMNGVNFSAKVAVTASEGRVRFTSPAILDGLELVKAGDRVTLVKNGISVQTDLSSLRGLLRPLTILTETDGEPLRIARQGDQYAIDFANGVSFTVSVAGIPRFVSFPEGSFRITDFS